MISPTVIHVGCQADHRFAPDCAVMLRSLLVANPDDRFEVHFLHDPGLPAGDLDGLRSVVTELGSTWDPIAIVPADTEGFPSMPRYGGLTAWYRLLLPRLLPNQERVLYLDADLMVVDSIRPLWETDLGASVVAAVTNPTLGSDRERVITDLGLESPEQYFNSGLMLLDLGELRRSGRMEQVERFVRERDVPMPWADQEPLNAVLARHRLPLHPRWNLMNPCYELPARLLPWSGAEVAEALARPAVIHFIGPYKAWHRRLAHPYKSTWHDHLAATPFATRAMEGTRVDRLVALVPQRTAATVRRHLARARAVDRRPLRALAQRTMRPRHLSAVRRARASLVARGPARADHLAWVLQTFADTTPEVGFVQIGSNDATHGDPLRELSTRRGWRGLLVEPVPYVFARLEDAIRDHPSLEAVNVAIGEEDGHRVFFHVAQSDDPSLPEWYDQIGSFSLDNVLHPYHLEHIPDLAERVVRSRVRTQRFESFWAEHALPRLDLLHIDAEGLDGAILRQVDLTRLSPTVVLYESKHLAGDEARSIEAWLGSHGYAPTVIGPDTVAIHMASAAPSLRRVTSRIRRST